EGAGFRLKGHKSVCSGAGHLDAYLVTARAAEVEEGAEPRISYFLVPGGAGMEVEHSWDPLGMRATASNGFSLDARVSADTLVGGVEGLVRLLAYAMPQWLVASYASVYVGVAQAALTEAVRHLEGRVVEGERGGLGRLASVRARLGRADAQVEGARLVLEEAGRRVDRAPGDPETNRWIYRAKLLAGDAAMEVAASLSEACGLGALRRPEAMPMLLAAAESEDASTRLVALAAIAESPLAEALSALMRAGADPSGPVRNAALGFVATRDGVAPTGWLIEQLARGGREAALTALAQPVDGRIEGILVALETADGPLASDLMQALLRMRRAHGNAAIEASLHLGNVHARRAAAVALVSLGTPEARAALALAAGADSDDDVRRIAAAGS
ncbi:MAG: acyl-CoA dehydrogenase family protein, partial [Polyangiaceae bacterium]